MNYLGIDYGENKIGIAFGEEASKLASPLMVLRVDSFKDGVEKVARIIKEHHVATIVIGVSEGDSADKARVFGMELGHENPLEIHYQDETLTTYDANAMSIQAGKGQKKRREMEDAYSATLILQKYFDENLL